MSKPQQTREALQIRREHLKAEAVKYFRGGMSQKWISKTIGVGLTTVVVMIREAREQFPDLESAANEAHYMPTPDEIRRECLRIRARNGHLRPEEVEEFSRI